MSISRRTPIWLTLSVGFFSLWASTVQAVDAVLDPASRMQDELRRAERLMPLPPPVSVPEAPEPLQLPEGPVLKGQIFLKEVVFSASQLLRDEQLQKVVQPYLGRDVGSEELNALLRDIQAMYLALGVQSAVPVVPPQDLQTGVLKVLLVEGTLGEVRFKGSEKPDADWLARWFDLEPGEVIRPEPLAKRLGLFNAVSDYLAEGQYVAGQQFGQSDLEVTVPETTATQYWAMTEFPAVGSGRTVGNSLIAGFRHFPVSATGGRVDGMVITGPTAATVSLTGGLPVGQDGWRFGGSASASRTRTRVPTQEADKGDLLIEGASNSLSLELARHVYWVPGQMWRLSGSVVQVQSTSQVEGVTLSDRSVQRLTLAASTDWVLDPASGAERAMLRATLNSARGPTNSYGYAEVFGSMAYRLDGAQGPVLRLNGQARWMDARQPDASDVWIAGGSASVRGFDPGAVYGRSGQALQAALYQPLSWTGVDAPEAFVFADHARAVRDDVALRIGSVGFGLQFQLNRQWAIESALTHQTQGAQGPRTRWLTRASVSW